MFPNVLMTCSLHLQLDHVTYKQFFCACNHTSTNQKLPAAA